MFKYIPCLPYSLKVTIHVMFKSTVFNFYFAARESVTPTNIATGKLHNFILKKGNMWGSWCGLTLLLPHYTTLPHPTVLRMLHYFSYAHPPPPPSHQQPLSIIYPLPKCHRGCMARQPSSFPAPPRGGTGSEETARQRRPGNRALIKEL
jgi:hypothetical protein